ncbi:hypothetical protein L195_g051078 [Trifolium pratense]|uniref:Neurobeachin-like protein n=1 Tax=Trifolium pratense TaxID=57577 RepID=A0A2K3JXQ0_TRIPR|nr:hypothetical protein L195_g051078 [Trifolium pratense]
MEDVWTMKNQLPGFMGTDPVGWIAVAEWFFEKNEVPCRDKLRWAFMSMEDEQARMWLYYWCEENPDADWKTFSMAMMRQSGAQVEYLTEKHVEPKLKVIEAFSDDREEVRIKETDHERETGENGRGERNLSYNTIMCEGIGARSLKILTNLSPSSESIDRKEHAEENEMQSVEEIVMQELTKSPDCGQPAMALINS